jgi:hypothetical protein
VTEPCLQAGAEAEAFIADVKAQFEAAPVGTARASQGV